MRKENKQLITNRNLTIINFIIVSYFIVIYLLYYFKIDAHLIGVFRELLSIPFLIAQLVFLVIGIKHLKHKPRHVLTLISILLLAICTVITIGSFF